MEFTVLVNNDLLFGNEILESLHLWDSSLGWLFRFLSYLGHYLGSNLFFMGILAVTYIAFSPRLGMILAWGLLSSGIVNSLMKFLFKSPRPYGLDPSIVPLQESAGEMAFGFPSGHSHTAIVIWGLLFYYVKHPILRIFSVFVVFIMPFARMYMGVHFLGDVLGGLIFGFINLVLVILFSKKFPDFPHIANHSRMARTIILATIAISLSPVLLLESSLTQPEVHSLYTTVISSASLAGAIIGSISLKISPYKYRLEWKDFRSSDSHPSLTLAVRLGVFILSVVLFYFVPSIVTKQFVWGEDILVRYFRYLIVGFFIVFMVPYLLFKIRSGKYLDPKPHE